MLTQWSFKQLVHSVNWKYEIKKRGEVTQENNHKALNVETDSVETLQSRLLLVVENQ